MVDLDDLHQSFFIFLLIYCAKFIVQGKAILISNFNYHLISRDTGIHVLLIFKKLCFLDANISAVRMNNGKSSKNIPPVQTQPSLRRHNELYHQQIPGLSVVYSNKFVVAYCMNENNYQNKQS